MQTKKTRKRTCHALMAIGAVMLVLQPSGTEANETLQAEPLSSATTSNRSVVSPADWKAIDHCLQIIRKCQMKDGMIRMKGAGNPVWSVPYCGNFAAMALLAANEVHSETQDVAWVQCWLLWYAANQEADGTINDRAGTVSSYKSNGHRDSTDSYAATFLMTARRYEQAIRAKPQPEICNAARKAFTAIQAVIQEDGLTIAKPDYPIKYLMDNIEVYGGLREGALFFDSIGDAVNATKARQLAARMASGLDKYWSEKDRCFRTALNMKGVYTGGLAKPYPDGLAQLFALAHVAPQQSELWQTVQRKFKPGDEGMPVERWLIAATRCATAAEQEDLRKLTSQSMLGFTAENVYVDRPALAIIALINGKARFPDILPATKAPPGSGR